MRGEAGETECPLRTPSPQKMHSKGRQASCRPKENKPWPTPKRSCFDGSSLALSIPQSRRWRLEFILKPTAEQEEKPTAAGARPSRARRRPSRRRRRSCRCHSSRRHRSSRRQWVLSLAPPPQQPKPRKAQLSGSSTWSGGTPLRTGKQQLWKPNKKGTELNGSGGRVAPLFFDEKPCCPPFFFSFFEFHFSFTIGSPRFDISGNTVRWW